MNRKLIRLTESDLHRIIKESVRRILREGNMITPHDLEKGCGYGFFKSPGDEDYVCEKYGDDMWREYVKWCRETHFFPLLFGYGYGTYEDGDIVTDDQAIEAFNNELTKLDSCPLFTPEQIQDLKNFIEGDIDDQNKEWQDNYIGDDD